MPWLWNLWLDRRGWHFHPDQDCGTYCPGCTAHAISVRGTASAAGQLSLHACSGSRAASAQAVSDTRLRVGNMPPSTERKARGLDLVARDKPSDNLMLKSGASWLQPSLPWARAQSERGQEPDGPGAGGLTSKPVTYGQHSPARVTCPTGLAPRRASQVGFGLLAGSGPGPTRAAQRVRPGTAPDSNSDESHQGRRLGSRHRHSATPVLG